jgi:hypothetical protein
MNVVTIQGPHSRTLISEYLLRLVVAQLNHWGMGDHDARTAALTLSRSPAAAAPLLTAEEEHEFQRATARVTGRTINGCSATF